MISPTSVRHALTGLSLASLCLWPVAAIAQDGADTRFRLDQALERDAAQENKRLKDADASLSGETTINIDGQTYTVGQNVSDVGQALYVTVMRKQWPDARRFLKAYTDLPGHDPLLLHFAQGAIARQDGDYRRAETEFRSLLRLRPDFLSGRLELARVLFEDQKDQEALGLWRAIRDDLPTDQKAEGLRQTAMLYIGALERRRNWQRSVSAGVVHNDNLNQSSASYTCLYALGDGTCLFDRRMPDPVSAKGIDMELSANRRLPLRGHLGFQTRALFFGTAYDRQARYNQSTVTVQSGLDYRTAKYSLGLSPTFDLSTYGGNVLYDAWGLRADASYTFSGTTALRFEARHKYLKYRLPAYAAYTGGQTEVSATVWHGLPRQWIVFAGPDYGDKQAANPADAYRQSGARLGLSKTFRNGASVFLLLSRRQRDHGAYSPLLEAKRRDIEQNLVTVIQMRGWSLKGFTPNLTLQRNRVRSNIDWLYSFERTSVSLRLERSI